MERLGDEELNKDSREQVVVVNPIVVEESCGSDDTLKQVNDGASDSMYGPKLLCLIKKTAPQNVSTQVMKQWSQSISFNAGGVCGAATVLPHAAIMAAYLVIISMVITVLIHETTISKTEGFLGKFVDVWTGSTFDLMDVSFASASFLLTFYLSLCQSAFAQTQSQVRSIQGKLQDCWLLFPLHSKGKKRSSATSTLSAWTYDENLSRAVRYGICSAWIFFQELDELLKPGAVHALNQLLTAEERDSLCGKNKGADMLKEVKHVTLLYWMEINYLRALDDGRSNADSKTVVDSMQRLRKAYGTLKDLQDDNGNVPYYYINFIYGVVACFLAQAGLVLPLQQKYCTMVSALFIGFFFSGLLELGERFISPFLRHKLHIMCIPCAEMEPIVSLSVVLKEIHKTIERYAISAPN